MADSYYQMTFTGAQLDEAINKVRNGYRDISETTAAPEDVLTGKKFVDENGNLVEGLLSTEQQTVTPSGSTQIVTPAPGSLLSKVTVNPIPAWDIALTAMAVPSPSFVGFDLYVDNDLKWSSANAAGTFSASYSTVKNAYIVITDDVGSSLTINGVSYAVSNGDVIAIDAGTSTLEISYPFMD